jgi:SAM-dependent methyltransferase
LTGVTCLICGGAFRPAEIPALLRCERCGFVSADMQLTAQQLVALYGEGYFQGEEYPDYVADRKTIERSFDRRLRTLSRFVADPHRKQLFEVGCAHGFFLNRARAQFAGVAGIDISKAAVEYAVACFGLPVQQGDLLSCELPPIDVVCLWDTIEHLANPDLYIERLASRMPTGGIIAITTGDIESLVARWRGAKWRQIHPPTHLHYFSKSTLSRLLDRHGFTVRYCGYDGMYRSLDMMAHIVLAKRRNRPGIYQALKRLGLLRFSVYLNLHDILFMIAEKRGGI